MLKLHRKNERNNDTLKYICFTLDLEEDHAGLLQNYYEGLKYLEYFIQIVKSYNIKISFFVQAKIMEKFPEKIDIIRKNKFDIHLHSYSHYLRRPKNESEVRYEITKSVEVYENFFGYSPKGYRFPLGIINNREYRILNELNFKFDSSIFPTLRPGYFNNLYKPNFPYIVNDIVELPFSVISNRIRIPIALSYIKILHPLHFLKNYHMSPIIFDFHLHDLFNLNSTKKLHINRKIHYIRNSKNGLILFLKFCEKLKKEGYHSIRIYDLYKKIIEEHKSGGSVIKAIP